ncbi:hypothetical protein [Sphingomonas astaxanthinifaciens]|uniref:Uncharacterized protein n=1 Tax=Sphingomonas astaxanthinifaciens DSM 22298 TaxID=1123267 RepID=A0ABQ5Z9V6_9SPHN|nr:hypothetical protein [Sphingomonas astaxanthinifaciens]GLR47643.1 hypothetical protein GCM10007925_13560 [Sphingomonas astaxanthinifaciens DSM 22298]
MRRILPFLSALMLVLVLWTGSAAQAAEAIGCAEVAASAEGHFDGDGDQVPADGDKATPHHHGACHGHCVGVSLEEGQGIVPSDMTNDKVAAAADFHGGNDPGISLRPPIA